LGDSPKNKRNISANVLVHANLGNDTIYDHFLS